MTAAPRDTRSRALCSLEELVKALSILIKLSPRAWMLPGLVHIDVHICIRTSTEADEVILKFQSSETIPKIAVVMHTIVFPRYQKQYDKNNPLGER